MQKEKKIVLVFRLFEELTYFVPHLFLGLIVATFFVDLGQYHFIITISLAIAYVALCYGERFYHKVRMAKDMVDNIIQQINEVETQVNNQKFVTLNGLMKFAEIIDEEVNSKIEQLRQELNKGVAYNEMDKEK